VSQQSRASPASDECKRRAMGLSPCTTNGQNLPTSSALQAQSFMQRFDGRNELGPWLGVAPGLIGVLLATPLVLELDQGTYRLAWTQSITPRRWLTTRLGLLLLGVVLSGLVMIALATYWRHPLDSLGGHVDLTGSTSKAFCRSPTHCSLPPPFSRSAASHAGPGSRRSRLRRLPDGEAAAQKRPPTSHPAAAHAHSPAARPAGNSSRVGHQPELRRPARVQRRLRSHPPLLQRGRRTR